MVEYARTADPKYNVVANFCSYFPDDTPNWKKPMVMKIFRWSILIGTPFINQRILLSDQPRNSCKSNPPSTLPKTFTSLPKYQDLFLMANICKSGLRALL